MSLSVCRNEYNRRSMVDKEGRLVCREECNIANQVWMVLAHVMNVEENRTIMTRAVKGAVSCKRYFSTLYVPSRDRGSF